MKGKTLRKGRFQDESGKWLIMRKRQKLTWWQRILTIRLASRRLVSHRQSRLKPSSCQLSVTKLNARSVERVVCVTCSVVAKRRVAAAAAAGSWTGAVFGLSALLISAVTIVLPCRDKLVMVTVNTSTRISTCWRSACKTFSPERLLVSDARV